MTRIAKVAEMIKIRSVLLRVAVVVGYSGSVVHVQSAYCELEAFQ